MSNLQKVAKSNHALVSRYQDTAMPFPSDDIDPKEKRGVWCRQWAEAMLSLFLNNGCFTGMDEINRIQLLRLYGAGRQPVEKYMDMLVGTEVNNPERKGYVNINWDIFSPAPKFKRIIRGRFEGQDYDYVATAIDPASASEREDMMWENYYKSQFGKEEDELMQMLGAPVPETVEYVAKNIEELEMFNSIGGFKLKKEIEIENALRYTDYISDIKEIKRKFVDDLVDFNKAAFRDYYDPIDKVVKYKYVDFQNLVIDYSRETDFRDARFWGYVEFKTINEVRSNRPDIPESALIGLANQYAAYWGNPTGEYINTYSNSGYRNKDGVIVYNQFKVPVMVCEWLSNDTRYKMKRTNKRGETLYYEQDDRKIYDTDKKKTVVIDGANTYACEWVIGTDIVYNDGVAMNAARVKKKIPALGIHAYALPGKAIMESIIPNLDQIQLTYLKLQSAIAGAPPSGLKIEVGSLSNINLGDGEKKPLELIKIYRQTGDILYKATTHSGKFNTYGSPIEKIDGGVGNFLDECIKNFEINFNYISEISGIDRFSAVSKKQGETSATEVNAATASTNDALQPLYSAYISCKEDAANTAACRIQMAVKYNPEAYNAYMPVLGKSQLELMKISKDVVPATMGIKVEVKPTQVYIQNVLTAATEALKPGRDGEKLTFPDWLLISRMAMQGNIKQAEALLQYRLELSRDRSLQLQQANMEENRKTALAVEDKKLQDQIILEKEKRLTAILTNALELEKGAADAENQIKLDLINAYLPQLMPQPVANQQNLT